jgi:hypothetical protein
MMISRSEQIDETVAELYKCIHKPILGDDTFTLKLRVYDGVLRPISQCHTIIKRNV